MLGKEKEERTMTTILKQIIKLNQELCDETLFCQTQSDTDVKIMKICNKLRKLISKVIL